MTIDIVPIQESHTESFRSALDAVARERKFLALTEAPALAQVRTFVMSNIESAFPHYVAIDGSVLVGWCDIRPFWAPAMRHRGTLGMGLIASHRGRGIGQRLMRACVAMHGLQESRASSSKCARTMPRRSECTKSSASLAKERYVADCASTARTSTAS